MPNSIRHFGIVGLGKMGAGLAGNALEKALRSPGSMPIRSPTT